MTVILDTHIWIWWLTASSQLSRDERSDLNESAGEGLLAISAVSLWEVQMLQAKRRVNLPLSFSEWLVRATDRRVVTVIPIDVRVILALDTLLKSFNGDPADRLIVATAQAHDLRLATHDRAIRRSPTVKLWTPRDV